MAKQPSNLPTEIVGPAFNFPLPPEKKESDYLNAYQGWVYSAVSTIARAVSMIELRLYRKRYDAQGELTIEEETDHEAVALLHKVNDYMTRQVFFEITQTYLDLTGEAVWVILRDGSGNPMQLWPLRPDWLTVMPSKENYIDHYVYRPGGILLGATALAVQGVKIKPEDLIFFKYPNPVNPYRGKGSVQAGAMAIDIDQFSSEWNRTFFFNSALPALIFSTEQKLSPADINRFMEIWRSKFEGRQNAHKVAFLGGGMKSNSITTSMKDLEFLEGKRYVRDEILAVFNVSKANLGIVEDVNRANMEATEARFAKTVVKPRLVSLISYLNEFYLRNWPDEDLFFDFDDPTPEDTELKLKIYDNGLKNGWLTINEVRERENLPPAEGGDNIYLPLSLQPVGAVKGFLGGIFGKAQEKMEGVITLKASKKSVQERIRDKLTMPIPPKRLREIRKDKIKKEIKWDLVKLVTRLMEVKNLESKKENRDAFWKNMVAATDAQEAGMVETLKNLWTDQRRQIVFSLNRELKSIMEAKLKATKDRRINNSLFNLDEETEKWRAVFAPFIKKIVTDRADYVFHWLGTRRQLDTTTEDAVRFLREKGLEFARSVNEVTLEKLRESLAIGVAQGESIEQLTDRVYTIYDQADEVRAEVIARTEVIRATNFATDEAYRQSRVVKAKEWLTATDEMVCPFCASLDGKIIRLDETYYDDGDAIAASGSTMTAGGDIPYPPLHPQCRCTLIPVIE